MNETGNSGRSVTEVLPDQVVADAMAAKRRDLIAQPLERIWPDLARAAMDALPGLYPSADWQPISTAPKDGSYILLYNPKYPRPFIGWLSLDGVPERDATVSGATHWQPLPSPPEAQQ